MKKTGDLLKWLVTALLVGVAGVSICALVTICTIITFDFLVRNGGLSMYHFYMVCALVGLVVLVLLSPTLLSCGLKLIKK